METWHLPDKSTKLGDTELKQPLETEIPLKSFLLYCSCKSAVSAGAFSAERNMGHVSICFFCQAFKPNKVAKIVRIRGQKWILKYSLLCSLSPCLPAFCLSPQLDSSQLDMFHLSLSIRGLCFHLLTSWHILFTVAVSDHLKWHSVGSMVSGHLSQPNFLWFARKLNSAGQYGRNWIQGTFAVESILLLWWQNMQSR